MIPHPDLPRLRRRPLVWHRGELLRVDDGHVLGRAGADLRVDVVVRDGAGGGVVGELRVGVCEAGGDLPEFEVGVVGDGGGGACCGGGLGDGGCG